jgi:hypothetical protein
MGAKSHQTNPNWLKGLMKEYESQLEVAIGLPTGTTGVSTIYPNGGETVVEAAILNEYGSDSDKIPARPFMHSSYNKIREKVEPIAAWGVKKINIGKIDKKTILGLMGAAAVGVVKQTITDFSTPPNAPYTIRKKGFNNPLIETGLLRQTITYAVRKSGKK